MMRLRPSIAWLCVGWSGQLVAYFTLFFLMDHNPNCSSKETSSEGCRPWEVAVIGLCASQHPTLQAAVQGPSGIPGLVLALNAILTTDVHYGYDQQNSMDDILEAISWLSQKGWAGDIASPLIISLLVKVLR